MGKDKKKSNFIADFKKFIAKGNIIDMAVGVVIGGAFGKIVTGLVNYIINPFVAIFLQKGGLDDLKTIIQPAVAEGETYLDRFTGKAAIATEDISEIAILWGTWLQTIIDFLIVALCIFIVLRVIIKIKERLNAKEIEEAEAKAVADKAKADAEKTAAAEKAAALAARQNQLEESLLNQEKLLSEICEIMKNK